MTTSRIVRALLCGASRSIAVALAIVACACSTTKEVVSTTTSSDVQRDSVYITHYDTLRIVERDTFRLQQLEQWHERVMARGLSTLQNPYCVTTAEVDAEGYLRHSLDTRSEASFPVRMIEVERIVRDTIFMQNESESTVNNSTQSVITKKVKKPLSWFVKTQIIALWVIVAVIIIKNWRTIVRVFSGWRI